MLLCFLTLVVVRHADASHVWSDVKLPLEHVPYYFENNPDAREACKADPDCPYKNFRGVRKCWGYEDHCPASDRMSAPDCPEDSRGWAKSKPSQVDMFWKEADFGYIKERKDELITICNPVPAGKNSSLKCAKFIRYCEAENIFLNFTNLGIAGSWNRYRENVLQPGELGGSCNFHADRLKAEGEHKSPLQSWYAELENYSEVSPAHWDGCDVFLDKPTYFIKLDAGINMFHHFCDYVNLYASQHIHNSFGTDVYVVMWDTSEMSYGDFFHDTWKVFTDHPVIPLKDFDGKTVCIREAVFSMLARMRFGLYYNVPLIPGCYGSSLFRAFSQHVLHRLNRTQEGPLESQLRITLLSRHTKYRNVMNEKELVSAMKTVGGYKVKVVEYDQRKMSFLDQLQVTCNSDIFLGIHGAGLTHTLFLPDWAVLFELYNCEDSGCYYDLSRLRGVRHMTWERREKLHQQDEGHHPTLGAHAKFTNYGFDLEEFMRLIHKAADHVREHKNYIEARNDKYSFGWKKDEL